MGKSSDPRPRSLFIVLHLGICFFSARALAFSEMVSFLRDSQTVQLLGQDKDLDEVCLWVAPPPPDSRSGC